MARVFVNNINSSVGACLQKQFSVEDEDNPTIFISTLLPNDPTRPNGIKKALNRQKPRLFRKYLLDCDIILYDLHTANLYEVEQKLKVVKAAKFQEQKVLVLVSSVFTWAQTPPKMIPNPNQHQVTIEKSEEKEQNEQESKQQKQLQQSKLHQDQEKQDLQQEQQGEPQLQYIQAPYQQSDFQTREPHPDFIKWRELQDLVLSMADKQNLKVYILCAGVLYGNGQMAFADLFKSAWLQQPKALPYIEPGTNKIPTIHVQDLAKAVKFIVDSKPEQTFVFAVDNTQDSSQLSLVQAISKGIGTGEVASVNPDYNSTLHQALMIDLYVKTSPVILQPAEGEETGALFEWHSLDGIKENIQKLNQEFNDKRGLKPVKVFISGPPASGKSFFAAKLSKHYRAPHVHLEGVLKEFGESEHQLAESVKQRTEKVSVQTLAEAFKWKLKSNACRNRGFILEGWPRNIQQANLLFYSMVKTKPEEGGQEQNEEQAEAVQESIEEKVFQQDLLPDHVAVLKSERDFLIIRNASIPANLRNQKHTDGNIARRYQNYSKWNLQVGTENLHDFFTNRGIQVFNVESKLPPKEIKQSFRIYIERLGRPFNYLKSFQELEEKRLKFLEEGVANTLAQQQEQEIKTLAAIQQQQSAREENAKALHQDLLSISPTIYEYKAKPLRQCLMENVMPFLAQGLLEICKVIPEDPVDYLSEFLYEQSVRYSQQMEFSY